MSTSRSTSRVKRPARPAPYVHRACEEMSNDVAAAENPDDQGDVDNRIFQTSLSAAIKLVEEVGEAHRFPKPFQQQSRRRF